MRIAISGASGYIAQNLIGKLSSPENEIIRINREVLYQPDLLKTALTGVDVVINLAGAPILQRWTASKKEEIMRSRAESTRNIVQTINRIEAEFRPRILLQASAVGIYAVDKSHDETSQNFDDGFVGEVVKAWEKPTLELTQTVRKVIFRIGVVLGKDSQTIKNILPVFQKSLGGKIGTGQQPFPFVHIDDLTGAFFWAMRNAEVHGVYNLVAPEGINNLEFTTELSRQLRRPAFFKVPAAALKLLYGEASSLLLSAPMVKPSRLLKYGFRFKYPDIATALSEITCRK